MIDKEDLLNNKDSIKFFKSGEDLTFFFKQIHKRAVEHMLNAEPDAHLDKEKLEVPSIPLLSLDFIASRTLCINNRAIFSDIQ